MSEPIGTVVRPYHEGDVPQLLALFARVFGTPITAEHWRWKLLANPAPACNVWLAVADQRPVFQYAGIAQRFEFDGAPLLGFVSVDTMTDPDFRRRGLLTQVATRAYDSWKAAGAAFVIGLPNQQWGSRAAALGWQELFPLRWLARPLEPQAYLARRMRWPWLKNLPVAGIWNAWFDRRLRRDATLTLTDVRRADAHFDAFWDELRGRYAYSTVRDSAWINWRFLDSPSRRYQVLAAWRDGRVLGYLAYRVVEVDTRVAIQLAEIITAPDAGAVRDTLLAELTARSRRLGAQTIATLAVPGTTLFGALQRAGFFAGPEFSVQIVPFATAPSLNALRERERWLMSGADYDVI